MDIQQETYTWRAVYDDGSSFYQENAENSFADVDLPRVTTLLLLSLTEPGDSQRMDIPQGATPVFFRRRQLTVNIADETATQKHVAHCIGWKRDDEAVYLFVFDDGSTLLTNDLQAV